MAPLRRQLAWLRVSAASLALFLLIGAGHVLPALHFALVVHRVCAEHGELIHEAAASAEQVLARGNDDSDGRDAHGPALRAGVGNHQHEHCGISALPGSDAVFASTPRVPGELLAEFVGVGGGERAGHVHIALLHYAPKLAPPAAIA